MKKTVSFILAFCLLLTTALALAEETPDLTSMAAEMDLIAAASQYSPSAPESVPNEEGVLSNTFVTAFFQAGQLQSAEVGVSSVMLSDVEAQKTLLQSIFAAEIPELSPIDAPSGEYSFIGFKANKVYTLENNDLQVIGGLYTAPRSIREMTVSDFSAISWFEEGIFVLRADETAMNGYRVISYSVGTDLNYEDAFQTYLEDVAVEYSSDLGFSFLYPAVFADELVVENENGVYAALQDGSASFSASRIANTEKVALADYVNAQAANHANAIVVLEDGKDYGTIFYVENGIATFVKISVTDEYIYQAQLSCNEDQLAEYSLYFTYLENSFVINELALG